MTIQISNTLTAKKEPFIPLKEGIVTMYVAALRRTMRCTWATPGRT